MYLNIKQVSKKLQKSERQVRYMINQEQLMPVNPDTYRRDGGYRFKEEEIEHVKRQQRSNGLTVKEAAKIVGISPQYLMQFVKNGDVDSYSKIVGKQKRRFFKLEDIERFKDRLQERTVSNREGEYGVKVQLISREVRIFEKVRQNGVMTRIVSTTPLRALTGNGNEIQIFDEIKGKGTWPERDYIKKKGFVEFSIPVPKNMEHPIYDLMYSMIFQLGKKNVQLYETTYGDYYLRCRLGKCSMSYEEYKLLLRYLEKGELHYDKEANMCTFESGFTSVTLDIPTPIFRKIEECANRNGTHTYDEIINVLEQSFT